MEEAALDGASRKGLWLTASAGFYVAVTSLDLVKEVSTPDAIATVRQRAVAYLTSGLYGYCADVGTERASIESPPPQFS